MGIKDTLPNDHEWYLPFMRRTYREMGTDKQLYEQAEIQTDALIE
jgi:hypothetical protein